MFAQHMAAMLSETNASDWPALAGMIIAFGAVTGLIGAAIAGMIVEPMIQKAKDEITLKIEDMSEKMVSKEIFKIYTDRDQAEHEEMHLQLRELSKATGNRR